MKKTLFSALILTVLAVACEEPRTDWSCEKESQLHNEAFENFNPAPENDEQVLEYAITDESANVLTMEVSVPQPFKVSPCYLEILSVTAPTSQALLLTAKNNSGEVTLDGRIAVPCGTGDSARKYKIKVTLPKDEFGVYSFRVRSYTCYRYGVHEEYVSTYAYSTATIEFDYNSAK